MTSFYLGTLALLLLGLLFALWPFIRTRLANSQHALLVNRQERREANVALYQDHLDELSRSLAQGQITQEQFEPLKQELERNLIEDSELVATEHEQNPVKPQHKMALSNRFYLGLVLVLLPLLSFVMYQSLGSVQGWQLQDLLKQQASLEQQLSQAFSAQENTKGLESQLNQVNRDLVEGLESFVKNRPKDLDNRVLLARTAVAIGEYDKAIEVYQQVLEKEPQAAQMMAELAQAIFVKSGNRVVPVVPILANQALSIQPNNVMALGLMGISAYQNAEYSSAIDYWQQAVSLYPAGSANALALQNGITRAQAALVAQGEQAVVAESTAPSTADQTTPADTNEGEKTTEAKIKVAVSLAEGVPVESDYAVFVYARAWQGAKVPLAIARLSAQQLPLTLELNESMSMAPGMTLATAEQVELIARLSPSGNAITQADDWQVSIGPIDPQNTGATVYPLVIAKPIAAN